LSDIQKLKDVIMVIFEKTKFYLEELRRKLNSRDDYNEEKLHLVAEYLAFDYIYVNENLEREVIEKAIYHNNLSIVEK
jgi:hypothetical protein